jgi:nucleoside-diphosphate-sugar epimerase
MVHMKWGGKVVGMKNVLVTGAGGFIGLALSQYLAHNGHSVIALVRGERVPQTLIDHPHITVVSVDIRDEHELKRVGETHRPEWVFHLAASNIQSGVTADPTTLVDTNVLGTRAVLEMAKHSGSKACVTMGSFLEYGQRETPLSEDMVCAPPELYSVSKLAGTLLAQSYAKEGILPHVISFRLFTPYGPGIQEGRLVREIITRALAGEPLLLTRPTVTRDFVFIDDIVRVLVEAAEQSERHTGHIYNLGSGEKTTLESLARTVLNLTESSSEITWGGFGNVSYDTDLWQADMKKTYEAFAWRPETPLVEGLEKTISWVTSVS